MWKLLLSVEFFVEKPGPVDPLILSKNIYDKIRYSDIIYDNRDSDDI